MTAPISVDPSALATTGGTVAGDGDAISAAIGSLDSALSGAGAMFGHDAAGIVFAQSYTASGKALLEAAASAVNACRRVGFGVQISAANYGHANSSSTVGGGTSSVPMPTAPAQFGAPSMPPPFGGGIAAPMGWALVEAFVGDVWPDGNPGELRAAAGAWRSFGAAVTGLAGQVTATAPGLGAQQIPEAGQMVQALGQIGGGLTDIASQAQALATTVDGFAATVEATQNAVRGLLHQLSPGGVLETIGGIFTGHNPIDEIKKVAHEIKAVLDNMKREADASSQLFSQGINMLDSATDSLETWANKEFTNALGQEVGGALSAAFNWEIDGSEGALKFVAETAQGISQLDPTRFAYDPSRAAKTWEGMLESTAVVTNPALLASTIAADPQGSLDTLKGVVDWKDVEAGHPGRAVGYNAAQVGSLLIPGVGEAAPAVEGAEVAGRAASVEERAVAGASRDAVPGLVGARSASESIAGQAGRVSSELDGIKVPESATPGAGPGVSAPPGRPPVDTEPPPVDAPGGRAPVDTAPPAERPHAPDPSGAQPHATEPVSPSSTIPAPPHDIEPSPPHADAPSPPHASEPAQVIESNLSRPPDVGSYESGPAASEPSMPTADASPSGMADRSGDLSAHAGADDKVPTSVGAHSGEVGHDAGSLGHGWGDGPSHGLGDDSGHATHYSSGDDHGHNGHDDGQGHDDGSLPQHPELSDEKRSEIVDMGHGNRPDPSEYLSHEFIEQHLHKFEDGATRFMIDKNYDMYGIGQRDGTTFVMPSNEVDALIDSANGDPIALARSLGMPEDYFLSDDVIRVDIPDPQSYELRVPSGNEAGANEFWLPGGFLPDGVSEAVIDGGLVPREDLTITDLPDMKDDE